MLGLSGIVRIFEEIEQRLVQSLKRNLSRHKEEEEQEEKQWSAWQAEKLRSLEKFRRENAEIMAEYTEQIDQETRQIMEEEFSQGVNSVDVPPAVPVEDAPAEIQPEPQFFVVDRTKVDKLIEDVTTLEKNAETAALRLTDDVYRQTVNRVQLAMSTGSMTLQQAIDTAVKDFLNQGINCIVYRDGRRVNIADYVRMALRTTATRAALQGKSAKFKALGYDTVQVSSYGMCSKTCEPWQGRIYIEDTFSMWDGEVQEYPDGILWGKSGYCGKWFPLLSSAIEKGLFHPNCRHTILLWRDGDPLPESVDNSDSERRYKLEQQQRALEREIRKAKRKVNGFTDPENVRKAKAELRQAQKELKDFIDKVNAEEGETVLRRDESKEKVYEGEVPKAAEPVKESAPPEAETRLPEALEPEIKEVPETDPEPPVSDAPVPEGKAVEVTVSEPEEAEGAYTEEPVPQAENVNNPSIDNSVENDIIEETEETREFNPLPPEKVVPEMRKAFDSWLPSVSGEEYSSLVKYTKNVEKKGVKPFFERLNTALRDKVILSDRMKYHSDNISNAINKFNLLHDIVCYRATKKNFFDKYSVGELFYADYFLSSSASRAGALKGKFLTIIRAPKGSRCAYIEKLSLYPSQREVLFDKSCQYRVVEKNDKYMVIEVINND